MRWSCIIFVLLPFFKTLIGAAPLLPTEDAFYSPPLGYESTNPGTILRVRKTPSHIRSFLLPINVKESYQLLVRTTDSHGNPVAIVTTILEPYNADPTKLVSYQLAEDSAALKCAPSYGIQEGAAIISTMEMQAEMILIQSVLNKGWFVVTPDYEGPNAAQTAGKISGQATLDSIRATLQTNNITGIQSDAQTVMWGYSGGSLATGWAAALQPEYAPELKENLIGAAVGGFLTNLTSSLVLLDGSLFVGLDFAGMNGLANEYPELDAIYKLEMTSEKYKDFLFARNACLPSTVFHFMFSNIFTGPNRYFQSGWDVFKNETFANFFHENTLAYNKTGPTPEIPMFIYHGKRDTYVSFNDTVRVYDTWCAADAPSVEFAVDDIANHITEIVFGSPAALAWINARFLGEEPIKGCNRTDRFFNWLYPGTDTGLKQVLAALYKSVLQKPIGPSNSSSTSSTINHDLSHKLLMI